MPFSRPVLFGVTAAIVSQAGGLGFAVHHKAVRNNCAYIRSEYCPWFSPAHNDEAVKK